MKLATKIFSFISILAFMGFASEVLCSQTRKRAEPIIIHNEVLSGCNSRLINYYELLKNYYNNSQSKSLKISSLKSKIWNMLQEDAKILQEVGILKYESADMPVEKIRKLVAAINGAILNKIIKTINANMPDANLTISSFDNGESYIVDMQRNELGKNLINKINSFSKWSMYLYETNPKNLGKALGYTQKIFFEIDFLLKDLNSSSSVLNKRQISEPQNKTSSPEILIEKKIAVATQMEEEDDWEKVEVSSDAELDKIIEDGRSAPLPSLIKNFVDGFGQGLQGGISQNFNGMMQVVQGGVAAAQQLGGATLSAVSTTMGDFLPTIYEAGGEVFNRLSEAVVLVQNSVGPFSNMNQSNTGNPTKIDNQNDTEKCCQKQEKENGGTNGANDTSSQSSPLNNSAPQP